MYVSSMFDLGIAKVRFYVANVDERGQLCLDYHALYVIVLSLESVYFVRDARARM